jgi:hypothetical protein
MHGSGAFEPDTDIRLTSADLGAYLYFDTRSHCCRIHVYGGGGDTSGSIPATRSAREVITFAWGLC